MVGSGSGTRTHEQGHVAGIDGNGIQSRGPDNATTNDAVIEVEEDDDGDEDESGELTGGDRRKPKKLTSFVWEYFTKKTEIVEMDGKKYEQKWGYCNYPNCKAKYRAECNYGTTGFRNHMKTTHHVVKGQLLLKAEKDHGKDITLIQPYRYDSEASVRKLHLAIIMHEYPFNIVEHDYFVDFIKSLRPSFPLKSRVTTRKEIMDIYLEEKEKLYAYFKTVRCRFSATMDMWTSCQNKSYMSITIHWIDDDWKIQKRILSLFHVEGRHTGHKLAETFTEVMVSWFVEKRLFSLTLDNASSNKVAVEEIIDDLKENANACLVCEDIFFHVRCACHILNLVARDGLSVISKTIEKIKALVLVVKGSPLQWEELMKRAAECGLDTNKGISLDVSTRWNSTYLMLYDALHYKPAFIRLKSSNRRKYANISPSEAKWEMATKICHCLKNFYDLTELLSGTSYPTANLFYRGFCEIKEILDKWCVCDDFTIREMAISMHEKFEKYWTNSSTSLAVASFLEPRYKKKLIEFYMRKFYGDYYQPQLDELLTVIKKLYQFYATKTATSSNTKSTVNGSSSIAADPLRENLDAELKASYMMIVGLIESS
ncbi:Unknown protein [Striga hermonthica]|uniref:hAT-like transposase RNase-H fold domain-containing protein n=1 Tax=Striga hermonthica TaxID=68872 RepID=A0A9N7R031_STRHE|nr:Unknown protein [Striga hermonthica]